MTKKSTASIATAPVLKLAPITSTRASAPVNQDCVDRLRYLLHLAVNGKMTGFACAAMCPDEMQSYDILIDVIGEADSNRVFAIGMVSSLNFQLMQEVNK